MNKKNWRNNLSFDIEQSLNELIKETLKYDYAIKKADDKSKAQIWIALALLNNKINQIDIRKNKTMPKIPKEELNNIIKTLETL